MSWIKFAIFYVVMRFGEKVLDRVISDSLPKRNLGIKNLMAYCKQAVGLLHFMASLAIALMLRKSGKISAQLDKQLDAALFLISLLVVAILVKDRLQLNGKDNGFNQVTA